MIYGDSESMHTPQLKTSVLLRQNLASILRKRNLPPARLAARVGRDRSWLSRFLNGKREEIQLADLDRLAAELGLSVHELLSPGVSRFTERRSGKDRRTIKDRRGARDIAAMIGMRAEIRALRSESASMMAQPGARTWVEEPGHEAPSSSRDEQAELAELATTVADVEAQLQTLKRALLERTATAGHPARTRSQKPAASTGTEAVRARHSKKS